MEACVASYAACFRPRLHGQLAHCQQYVKGLFHACRSNVERMNERLPDSSYDALHHFISESSWDGEAVMDEVARWMQATLAEVAGEQGLLLDECGWEKAGTKSVGVGRQYIGQVGKISNGQVGVFAVLSRGTSAGLVGEQLYLPEAWCADAARCAQARVPLAVRGYRSKPALAAALVAQDLVRADWVGGDAAYGNSPALRQALQQRGQAYVLDVGPGLHLYLADPTPVAAPAWSGRGRPPRRVQPLGTAQALPELAAQVPASAWQAVTYRPGQKGPLVREAVLLPAWRWEKGESAQALQLLISRELDGTQVKFSLCYSPPQAPALGVGQVLYRQMQRYWIERVFQEAKQQLGLHQNQTRSWPAWQHHVALTMMALHLLLDTQLRERETMPSLSFASLKLVLAQKLQNLLHQDAALLAAIHQRAQANAPKQPRTHSP
ncbi:MAG: IS701 family transposase [Janthinobacterium lividum]